MLSLHLSSLIQLEGLCGTKCKNTTSDSLIRRLPRFISQHISIVGHYVLCNITLRDKSGDAIRNQSQFVHRNRLTIRTISFISKDAARGNLNPQIAIKILYFKELLQYFRIVRLIQTFFFILQCFYFVYSRHFNVCLHRQTVKIHI